MPNCRGTPLSNRPASAGHPLAGALAAVTDGADPFTRCEAEAGRPAVDRLVATRRHRVGLVPDGDRLRRSRGVVVEGLPCRPVAQVGVGRIVIEVLGAAPVLE